MAWLILAVLVAILAFVMMAYNSLVQLRVRADSAWSDIDVQLKRRHDLIPNLVETVKATPRTRKGPSRMSRNIARWPCPPPRPATAPKLKANSPWR